MYFRGCRPGVSQRRVSVCWHLGPLKATYDIYQRENQEEGSRRAEKLPTQLGVSWPGMKEGTGVCLTSMSVSGNIHGTFTIHQAEAGPVTSVVSFTFLKLWGRSHHPLVTNEESESQEASIINALLGILSSLSACKADLLGLYIFILWHLKKSNSCSLLANFH